MQTFRIGRIEKLDQTRQAPRPGLQGQSTAQRLIQVRRFAHGRGPGGRRRGAEFAQPGLEEFDVPRRGRQLQRVETGGDPVLQRQVLAAQGPHQDLEAAILVEHDLGRSLTLQHGDQEADEYRLARSGGAADERMARVLAASALRVLGVAGVQRKIVRRTGAGDEQAQCRAPVISGGAARGVVVKWRHGREIARRDRRLAGPEREISRQLRPERGFQSQILARHQHAGVGENAARQGNMVVQRLEPPSPRQIIRGVRNFRQQLQREVMIAHHELVAGERVQRLLELRGLRDGEIAGIRHAVELTLQECLAGGFREKGEGLRQNEGERRGQQPVVHPGHAGGRVFLDAEHRAHPRLGGRTVLDGFGAEEQARGRQRLIERARGQRHSAAIRR